jgi:hypothetical protein
VISTVVGGGQGGDGGHKGPATAAAFNAPLSMALDLTGELYICRLQQQQDPPC